MNREEEEKMRKGLIIISHIYGTTCQQCVDALRELSRRVGSLLPSAEEMAERLRPRDERRGKKE